LAIALRNAIGYKGVIETARPEGNPEMTYNPEWHRQYGLLELAESIARNTYRAARGKKKDAAMIVLCSAGKARFDFEMAGCTIVDVATLAPAEWLKAMCPKVV
jgi:hypothetical protein